MRIFSDYEILVRTAWSQYLSDGSDASYQRYLKYKAMSPTEAENIVAEFHKTRVVDVNTC